MKQYIELKEQNTDLEMITDNIAQKKEIKNWAKMLFVEYSKNYRSIFKCSDLQAFYDNFLESQHPIANLLIDLDYLAQCVLNIKTIINIINSCQKRFNDLDSELVLYQVSKKKLTDILFNIIKSTLDSHKSLKSYLGDVKRYSLEFELTVQSVEAELEVKQQAKELLLQYQKGNESNKNNLLNDKIATIYADLLKTTNDINSIKQKITNLQEVILFNEKIIQEEIQYQQRYKEISQNADIKKYDVALFQDVTQLYNKIPRHISLRDSVSFTQAIDEFNKIVDTLQRNVVIYAAAQTIAKFQHITSESIEVFVQSLNENRHDLDKYFDMILMYQDKNSRNKIHMSKLIAYSLFSLPEDLLHDLAFIIKLQDILLHKINEHENPIYYQQCEKYFKYIICMQKVNNDLDAATKMVFSTSLLSLKHANRCSIINLKELSENVLLETNWPNKFDQDSVYIFCNQQLYYADHKSKLKQLAIAPDHLLQISAVFNNALSQNSVPQIHPVVDNLLRPLLMYTINGVSADNDMLLQIKKITGHECLKTELYVKETKIDAVLILQQLSLYQHIKPNILNSQRTDPEFKFLQAIVRLYNHYKIALTAENIEKLSKSPALCNVIEQLINTNVFEAANNQRLFMSLLMKLTEDECLALENFMKYNPNCDRKSLGWLLVYLTQNVDCIRLLIGINNKDAELNCYIIQLLKIILCELNEDLSLHNLDDNNIIIAIDLLNNNDSNQQLRKINDFFVKKSAYFQYLESSIKKGKIFLWETTILFNSVKKFVSEYIFSSAGIELSKVRAALHRKFYPAALAIILSDDLTQNKVNALIECAHKNLYSNNKWRLILDIILCSLFVSAFTAVAIGLFSTPFPWIPLIIALGVLGVYGLRSARYQPLFFHQTTIAEAEHFENQLLKIGAALQKESPLVLTNHLEMQPMPIQQQHPEDTGLFRRFVNAMF